MPPVLLFSMAPLVPLVVDEHLNTPTAGVGVTVADAFSAKIIKMIDCSVWFGYIWFGMMD